MNQPKDPNRKPEKADASHNEPAPSLAASSPTRQAYQAPKIVSSKIFHKVMLSTPQPGFPGCTNY